MGESFEVVFRGEIKAGADLAIVKQGLARLFGQPSARIEALFCGREVVIKTGIDRTRALRYQADMARVGALCLIRPVGVIEEVRFAGARSDVQQRSNEFSLSGVFAALMVCPRCGHQQLEGEFCAHCRVSFRELELEQRRQRKRERIFAQRRAGMQPEERIDADIDHGDVLEIGEATPRQGGVPGAARRAIAVVAAVAVGIAVALWFASR